MLVVMAHESQFDLLRKRRFAPYFLTQLLSAFNDNVYKNALVALIAFSAISSSTGNDGLLINLSAGLFILPFFLFSAFCGQLADKFEKSMLIRRIKLAEIVIMAFGAAAFWLQSVPMLIGVLFLMGTQSAFFGPIKYGILPQHLSETELVGGNGLVELGTFLAILIGTIAGTQLIAKAPDGSVIPVCIAILSVAIVGYLVSRGIPKAAANDPELVLRFNPAIETWKLVRDTAQSRVVFQSILAISWFWLLGATYLAQFPVYARDVLGGSVDVFTALLATFSIGIAVGSILCERLSHGRIEIGLVPFGIFGMTLFGITLVLSTPASPLGSDMSVSQFLFAEGASAAWKILASIFLLGMFGGFYIVPLYALIQKTSEPSRLSRAFACNNILNAFFMVMSAVLVLILLSFDVSIKGIFLVMALLNAVVAAYVFSQVPEFMMRFIVWLLVHTLYRVRKKGMENIPDSGPAIVVANHVSFIDALILGGCIRRPVRFVMYYKIFKLPVMNFVFRTAKAIPIAGQREDKAMYDKAFVDMKAALADGDLLCIFPEGEITRDGQMNPFKPGILRVLESQPVDVVPIALQGLWGSLFSRKGGRAFLKMPRRLFARLGMIVGEPIPAAEVTLETLHSTVADLRGDRW